MCYSFPRKNKIFTLHLVNLLVLNFYFDLILPFYFPKWNHYFSACENLPNSSYQFWKCKSVFLHISHQSSVLSNITPVYFFNSNIIYFAQKELIEVKSFETLEYSGKKLTNSSYQFWNNKSIPLQILHHSSVSWKITSLYVFISNSINFAQKWPIKVNIFKNTCILYWEKLNAYLPLYFLTAL